VWLWPRTQWQQSWSYRQQSWTYTATVDFVADLLPVSAAVDFQQSRTSWIQLFCQYVPGFSHLSNKPVRNWTLCIPTYNWEVQVENRVPKLANPVSQTAKPSFPQKVAVKTVFMYTIQTLLSKPTHGGQVNYKIGARVCKNETLQNSVPAHSHHC